MRQEKKSRETKQLSWAVWKTYFGGQTFSYFNITQISREGAN